MSGSLQPLALEEFLDWERSQKIRLASIDDAP
jgi:hypothetical protein